MDKAAVFIDAGYLNSIQKNAVHHRIDYLKLSDNLCKEFARLRTYYYTSLPFQSNPPTPEENELYGKIDKFIFNLKSLPRFQIRLGRFQRIAGDDGRFTFIQKGVDVMLAVDLVKISLDKQIQKAIIVAADSDFVYAVQAARDAGVLTELAYSPNLPINSSMPEAFDERTYLTSEFFDKCKLL